MVHRNCMAETDTALRTQLCGKRRVHPDPEPLQYSCLENPIDGGAW